MPIIFIEKSILMGFALFNGLKDNFPWVTFQEQIRGGTLLAACPPPPPMMFLK